MLSYIKGPSIYLIFCQVLPGHIVGLRASMNTDTDTTFRSLCKTKLRTEIPSTFLQEKDPFNGCLGKELTMTTGNLSRQIPLSTPNPQQNHQALTTHKHPMNDNWKNKVKMEAVYEEPDDETMEDGSLNSASTTPTRHSARLAAKLEKLRQTDQTLELHQMPMAMDTEEQKKRARAITPGANKLDIAKQDQKTTAPEIKKLRNDETPPCQIARKAKAQEVGMTNMDTETAEEKTTTE